MIFLLVSCMNFAINLDSPENLISSFPPLLTNLVFILLDDGGVDSMVQLERKNVGKLQNRLM